MCNYVVWLCFFISLFVNVIHCQSERWVYQYDGSGHDLDKAFAVVYGGDANIYAAGYTWNTFEDFTVVSLTPGGNERWLYRYDGPGRDLDIGLSVAYGVDGNIYAAGISWGALTSDDFLVVSLDADGNERWVYRYNGPANSVDGAYAVVYGEDGNIYVAGRGSGIGSFGDFTVISLTPQGDERWVYTYNGSGSDDDCASSIVYGTDGHIYVAGVSYEGSSSDDFTIISITTSGDERWVYHYNGSDNYQDCARAIVFGSDGNIYAAGKSYESGAYDDFTVVSIDTSGAERWVYTYNGPDNLYDDASSIAYGADGHIYAAGGLGSGTWHNFCVISITSSGTERWVYSYDGTAHLDDWAYSVAYGSDGNIYAIGDCWESGSMFDLTIISLNSSGGKRWVYNYDGPGNYNDEGSSIIYGLDGYVYAAGASYGGFDSDLDFAVLSLDPVLGIEECATRLNPDDIFSIVSRYFRNSITIRFVHSCPAPLRIRLFDILGSTVYETILTSTPSLVKLDDPSILKLSNGVYFLSISQGNKHYNTSKLLKF